jgi:hypothetical protein
MERATLIRVLRILGAVILVTAPFSALLVWSDAGPTTGFVLFGVKLYVGTFCLWGLPWILKRQAG